MLDPSTEALRQRLEAAVAVPRQQASLTVAEFAAAYMQYAQTRHTERYGDRQLANITAGFKPVTLLYGDLNVRRFGPMQLMVCRRWMIEQRWKRSTIECRVSKVRQAWRWGVTFRLIPPESLKGIEAMPPLRRREAPEPGNVLPVDLAVFEATLIGLRPVTGIMLRVMLLGAMRPGEVCDMRACDITNGSIPWCYSPADHKNAHRGLRRDIMLGPRAVALLQPVMPTSGGGHVFLTHSGQPWTVKTLGSLVAKACRRLGVPHWHPNQLRHTAATIIRASMGDKGLEAAQHMLGHKRREQTETYAEKSSEIAREVAMRFG